MRLPFAALVLFAMTMTAFADNGATGIAAVLTSKPSKLWQAIMVHYYGPYDRSRKCWSGKPKGKRFCMRPLRLDTVTVDDALRLYVAMGGHEANEEGQMPDCHACPGTLGLVILEERNGYFYEVATNGLDKKQGSWGVTSGEESVRLAQLGPSGLNGWMIDFGYTGQGYTSTSTTVHAPVDGAIVALGSLFTGGDDSGVCEDGRNLSSGAPCFSYEGVVTSDRAATPVSGYYPLKVRFSGTRDGKPFDRQFRVPYEPGAKSYSVPDGYPE